MKEKNNTNPQIEWMAGATSGREPLRQPERDRHGSGEDGLLLEQPGNF